MDTFTARSFGHYTVHHGLTWGAAIEKARTIARTTQLAATVTCDTDAALVWTVWPSGEVASHAEPIIAAVRVGDIDRVGDPPRWATRYHGGWTVYDAAEGVIAEGVERHEAIALVQEARTSTTSTKENQ